MVGFNSDILKTVQTDIDLIDMVLNQYNTKSMEETKFYLFNDILNCQNSDIRYILLFVFKYMTFDKVQVNIIRVHNLKSEWEIVQKKLATLKTFNCDSNEFS